MAERNRCYDIAKGLLILALPIHHYWSAMSRLMIATDYDYLLTDWQFILASFFMSEFFVISGMCSNFDYPFPSFIKRIIKRIVFPYLSITFITTLVSYFFDGNINGLIRAYTSPPNTTLWFLLALAYGKIVVFLLIHYSKDHFLIISFFLLILGVNLYNHFGAYNFFAIFHSLVVVFFIAFGHWIKDKEFNFIKDISLLLFPIILSLLHHFLYVPQFTAGIYVYNMTIPFFILLSILGTFSILKISCWIGKSRVLEFFGRNSLIVYGLHFICMYRIMGYLFVFVAPLHLYIIS